MTDLPTLTQNDLSHVVRRLPKDIRDLLTKFNGTLWVGGGFIRAVVAGETVSDIDLFGVSKEHLTKIAEELQASRGGKAHCRLHHTKNAITVITLGRTTVQFITRWTFTDAAQVCSSFDFTVCQAVVWRNGATKNDPWRSQISSQFYIDLAARRLTYTAPIREEEAGGSLMRVMKYAKRGYTIQIESLAGVVARLTAQLDTRKLDMADQPQVRHVLRGLLQEVDPSIAVDGLELTDDHETPDSAFGLEEQP